MWKRLINVWRKELIDSLRDRKSLRTSVLTPILMGLVFALFTAFLTEVNRDEPIEELEPQAVSVIGEAYIPADLNAIFDQFLIEVEPYAGTAEQLAAAVKDEEIEFGLVMPEDFAASISAETPASPTIIQATGSSLTDLGSFNNRVATAFDRYNEQVLNERLTARGIDPNVLTPIQVETRDVSFEQFESADEIAGSLFAGLYFPIIFATAIGAGGLMTAIDATAGEKERGTLESLLLTPATDSEIFLGKTLAVLSMTVLATILSVIAFLLASNWLAPLIWDQYGGMSISAQTVVISILLCIPYIFLVSLFQMLMALRTKSAKDAQTSVGFANMLVLFPMMGGAFLRPSNPLLHLIPGLGTASIIGKLASVEPVMQYIPYMLVSVVLLGVVGTLVGLRMFNRERLLYSM